MALELKVIPVEKPEEVNFIFGQAHFIKTVEDLYEALVGSVPGIRFGLAFCEASAERLVRTAGTDEEMVELATKNALAVGAGHTFFVFLKNVYPINVLKAVQAVPEVVRIFCATANPTQVIVAETEQGRGVLGVVDGLTPVGVEGEEAVRHRIELLRKIGYKLGG